MTSSTFPHGGGMATDPALVAHLLRRLTFGPRPGEVDRLRDLVADVIIRTLLDQPAIDPEPPELGTDDDYSTLLRWWLDVMASPDAGLHERMVWFWHGHLTSSFDQAEPRAMYRQHRLFRDHALGNFRVLLRAIAVDPAMLWWLDGDGSTAESPNENFGREVMELFALGHGAGYTEVDVRAAAVACSGWWVDDDGDAQFDEESGPHRSVRLLGVEVRSIEEAIDVICDHPACAPHVAGAIHEYLVGHPPEAGRREELGEIFRSNDLDIASVVEAIVTGAHWTDPPDATPRSPVEWWVALRHLYDVDIEPWALQQLGQLPFEPPDVAGWPGGSAWISAGAVFAKAQIAVDHAWDVGTLDATDPVGDVLARAGAYDVSEATRDVLDRAARATDGRRDLATVLHALVAMSPEFSLT